MHILNGLVLAGRQKFLSLIRVVSLLVGEFLFGNFLPVHELETQVHDLRSKQWVAFNVCLQPAIEHELETTTGAIDGNHHKVTGLVTSSFVFFHNDDMAIGAVEAIKAAGIQPGDLVMISVDGTRGGFQLMLDGWLQADVECNPLLGPQVMDLGLKLMNGEEIAKEALTDEQTYYADQAEELLPSRKY